MSDFKVQVAQNSISAGAMPQNPDGGAYRAPPDSIAGFKGPTFKKGEKREGGRMKGKREREGRRNGRR